jgi:hypothetical protein
MSIGTIKVEVSPTSKCSCHECDALIAKGSYRLCETFGAGKWQKTLRYCQKCAVGHLRWVIGEYTKQLRELEGV